MNGRAWEPWEDDCLRRWYKAEPISDIEMVFERPRSSIYRRARILGLAEPRHCASGAEITSALRRWHPRGWTDSEIARWLGGQLGCRVNRHRVGVIRRGMGLPDNALSEHRRRQVAAKTREQLAAKGLQTLAQERVGAFDRWKESLGWPTTLTVRAVQAVELFYRHGPMTRLQLCAVMGITPKKRTYPTSNAKGGTVLAELQSAGLVMRLRKAVPLRGKARAGKTKCVDLYCLNPGVVPDGRKRKRIAEAG